MRDRRDWAAIFAALSGALAIIAGAFGTHGAHGKVAALFATGGHYQLVHAVAALVAVRFGARSSAWLFVIGAALFAISLYALALGALPIVAGPVTPIGGALLIAGWLCFACRFFRQASEQ